MSPVTTTFPLRPIVGVTPHTNTRGRLTWIEQLACGHPGEGKRWESDVLQSIRRQTQRRCRQCATSA